MVFFCNGAAFRLKKLSSNSLNKVVYFCVCDLSLRVMFTFGFISFPTIINTSQSVLMGSRKKSSVGKEKLLSKSNFYDQPLRRCSQRVGIAKPKINVRCAIEIAYQIGGEKKTILITLQEIFFFMSCFSVIVRSGVSLPNKKKNRNYSPIFRLR